MNPRAEALLNHFWLMPRPGDIVEFGCSRSGIKYKGAMNSTLYLSSLAQKTGNYLVSVDADPKSIEYAHKIKARISGIEDDSRQMKAGEFLAHYSGKMAALLLDCEGADSTKTQFTKAVPFMLPGCVVAVDDVSVPGNVHNEGRKLGKADGVADWLMENGWGFTVEYCGDTGFAMLFTTKPYD